MTTERLSAARAALLGLSALIALAGPLATPSTPALAGTAPVYTSRLSDVSLGGFDPVAYFMDGKSVEGSRQFTFMWKGAIWRFASQGNRDAFSAAPERYAPQYGGYCAWAASQNYVAPGDPRHWRIVSGKLYVNYDARVQTTWERDIPGHIKAADANWPGLLAKN
jgi:hypothetical protein